VHRLLTRRVSVTLPETLLGGWPPLIDSVCLCDSATDPARGLLLGFIRLPTEGYTQGGRFSVGMRRDQELEGADNTRFRQVQAAICVMPYVLYDCLYCLDVDLVILVLRGSLPTLIYPGGQSYMNHSLILT
jgi:hypothetical protein